MTPLRAVALAVLAVVTGVAPAAAHHTGVYTPKDNAISANFKQLKFSLQAGKFDVALRLYDEGALRAEMRARAAALPAGLEARTRAALAAHDAGEAERGLMLFFVALARDLAREADRRLPPPAPPAPPRPRLPPGGLPLHKPPELSRRPRGPPPALGRGPPARRPR